MFNLLVIFFAISRLLSKSLADYMYNRASYNRKNFVERTFPDSEYFRFRHLFVHRNKGSLKFKLPGKLRKFSFHSFQNNNFFIFHIFYFIISHFSFHKPNQNYPENFAFQLFAVIYL